jgi:metal-sulfur cluster biosynthetic enzyme
MTVMTAQYMREYRARPDVSNERRVAFIEALEEVTDPDVRNEVTDLIEAVTILLMERGNLKEYAATNQATEFVAACVWGKVQGRKGK